MYDICDYKHTEKHLESILDGNKEPSLFGESSRSDIVSQSFSRLRELQVHRQAVLSGHFVDHSHRLDPSTARLCEMLHVSHEVFSRKTPYLTCICLCGWPRGLKSKTQSGAANTGGGTRRGDTQSA